MDIEEIKRRMGGLIAGDMVDHLAMNHALLWIIEKLQEQPTIKVAQVEPGDTIVAKFDRRVPDAELNRYRETLEAMWPDHPILLTEGIDLMVVGERCCSLPDDIPHSHASFSDVMDADDVKRTRGV